MSVTTYSASCLCFIFVIESLTLKSVVHDTEYMDIEGCKIRDAWDVEKYQRA